ncbi:MAG TPA: 30S ribosomal protein S20 [Lactobacillaceae bacterium]|jgi:small subunit ribosomal protein S20
MPVIASAIQRVRLNKSQRLRRVPLLSTYRTAVKKLEKASVSGEGNLEELYKAASSAIDRAYSKGLIKKNKANRDKSRLAKYVK